MVVTTNLLPNRDRFHLGLRFQAQTSIVLPGPAPFTVTQKIEFPRTETLAWGILTKLYDSVTPFQVVVGEGLATSRLQVPLEAQANEDEPAKWSVEIRGDTGAVIDTGEQTLPWSWAISAAKGTFILEQRLIQMQGVQSAGSSDLQRILDAVYLTWPSA